MHDTALGRIGALCCWEHLQPLSKYAMYAQNEQVHIAAWPSFSLYRGAAYALGPEVNNAASQLYAVEGQCFVLAPCANVSKEMVEMLCTDDGQAPASARRAAASPASTVRTARRWPSRFPEDQEGIVYADLDLGMISLAKAAADPSGHYSRPDVTRLMLNQTPGDRVIQFSMPGMVVAESSNARIEQAAVAAERESASAAKKALAKT